MYNTGTANSSTCCESQIDETRVNATSRKQGEANMRAWCLASTRAEERSEWQQDDDQRSYEEHQTVKKQSEEPDASMQDEPSGDKDFDSEDNIPSDSDNGSDSESESDSDASESTSSESLLSESLQRHTSCIQQAQLTPGGMYVFASDYGRSLSVYPINTETFSDTTVQPLSLYSQFSASDPIWAFDINPNFNAWDRNTTTALVSTRESYISLYNALYQDEDTSTSNNGPVDISKPVASYKLINKYTEAVIAPSSLTYTRDGASFFAGHKNAIAKFDINQTHEPIFSMRTIPSDRNTLVGGGLGFKGIISALSIAPSPVVGQDGLLAAGSRTSHIGIYDPVGGEETTSFSLHAMLTSVINDKSNTKDILGSGITKLRWSPCARYLYVAERTSDAISIFDTRNFKLCLGYCKGRNALTKQKLGFDIWTSQNESGSTRHEIWAGGMDGVVRVWQDPHLFEGAVEPEVLMEPSEGKDIMPVVDIGIGGRGSWAMVASGSLQVGDDESRPKGKYRHVANKPRRFERGSVEVFGLQPEPKMEDGA